MTANEYLTAYSKDAERFLNSFFLKKKRLSSKIDPGLINILQVFQDYIKGGKKARGALTVLGYQACGGKDMKAILPVSCGIELFHSFLLIHDDIIDRDKKRRGKPTVHTHFASKRGEHYGNSKAIIIGDVGAFLAYELILSSNFSKDRTLKAVTKLNEFLLKTGYGQLLDIDYDFKKDISWNDILKVRTYKTAFYTIVMPLSVGAILAGADEKLLSGIEKYGIPVGIAFQLSDDILGVFGDSGKTGKSAMSDIKEGKKTFLYVKALELAKGEDKKFLQKWYGAKDVNESKAKKIREIIESCGALIYSQNLSYDLVKKGKRYVGMVTKKRHFQKVLESLADFVVRREK